MNILFDLDGTLTDPREGIVGCIRHALCELGRACPPDRELERFIGPPLQESFFGLLSADSAKVAAAMRLYRERFAATGMFENVVYPEMETALAALKDRGAALYVATSKPAVFAERILEHFGLARYFEAIHGSELDGTRADKGELIAHVLGMHGMAAAEACMVGDRRHDMQGAAANGLRAVGVLWGYGSRDELLAAGATVLCERPAGLPVALAPR